MTDRIARNRRRHTDLFAGPFPGHLFSFAAPPSEGCPHGDFTLSDRPVREWVPSVARSYAARVAWLEQLDDDSVPQATLLTHTGVFAEAFGCRIHAFEGSNAAALPFVHTAAQAVDLPTPDWSASRSLARWWELAELVRAELGPAALLTGPDIQSPFDIAALIWNKEEMFVALIDTPEAVLELVAKTEAVLTAFLEDFRRAFPNQNIIHCPSAACAPPELGCSLSEDEVGSLSPAMFERFCLPSLTALSDRFGGLFMHCCAAADPHYPGFRRIPRLRGLNRVFQYPPGPQPAIDLFSGHTAFLVGWTNEQGVRALLDMARPDTRYFFDLGHQPLAEAQRTLARMRGWCGRE